MSDFKAGDIVRCVNVVGTLGTLHQGRIYKVRRKSGLGGANIHVDDANTRAELLGGRYPRRFEHLTNVPREQPANPLST